MKNSGTAALVGSIQLGLRTQILLLGMAGVIVVGLIYLAGLRFEDDSRMVADRFAALESHTARLSEGLLQGRETATEFLQKPNEKKVAAHEETIKSAIGHLGEIESIAGTLPDGDVLRQALTFRAVISNYTTRFSNVVSAQKLMGYNENDGLQGKLRAAVHSVESKLKTFDQPRLSVLMLMMRRHEKDFILRGDEKYGDELKKRAGEFLVELQKTDLPADAKAEIVKLVDTYKTSFLSYMAGQSTLVEEAEDLAQIYDRMRPNLNGVRKAAGERLEAVKADLAEVRRYVFWSILVTVATMMAAALWFGRRVTAPLMKMVEAMDGLARGDLDRRSNAWSAATRLEKYPTRCPCSTASLSRIANWPRTAKRASWRPKPSASMRCIRLPMASRWRSATSWARSPLRHRRSSTPRKA